MRQYWRDFDSLERWTRTLPHKRWWQEFLRESAGTGSWPVRRRAPGMRLRFFELFHPDAVQRVSARQPDRHRRDNACYPEVRWAFGDGLLNSQGGRWLRQRRSVQPLFTHRVAGYAGAMAGPRPESDKEANMHPSADGGAHARGRDRREQEELRRLGQAMLLACIKEWDRQEHARVVALVEAEQAEQAAIDRARRTLSTGADGTAG